MIAQPLFDQFSAAAQKYKTGVLKVSGDDRNFDIVIVDGRVIDVSRSHENDRLEFLRRLAKIGAISDEDRQRLEVRRPSNEDLERYLVEEMEMSLEDISELRAHIALDALYEVGRLQNPDCEFTFQGVRDHEGPGIDVNFGQFLLDVVEFSVDEERADEVFDSLERGRCLVIRGEMPERLLPFEQLLLSLVAFPATFEDLEHASMTHYELVESVLSLLDQGVLALEGEETGPVRERRRREADKRPEAKSDAAESEPAEQADGGATRKASPRGVVAGATATDDGVSRRKAMMSRQARGVEPAVLTRDGAVEETKKRRTASGRRYVQHSLRDRIIDLNYTLLEERQLQSVILWTHELFLLAVLLACLSGPHLLDTWFQGLSEFTSSLLPDHGTLVETVTQ